MKGMAAPTSSFRSRAALIVLGGLWLLALLNLGRAVALWQQADWRSGLPMSPDPRWRLAFSLAWAALFVVAAVALWAPRPFARRFIPLLLAVHGVYELSMMLRYASSPPALLPILVYGAFVAYATWALWRPAARRSFNPSPPTHKEVADRRTL